MLPFQEKWPKRIFFLQKAGISFAKKSINDPLFFFFNVFLLLIMNDNIRSIMKNIFFQKSTFKIKHFQIFTWISYAKKIKTCMYENAWKWIKQDFPDKSRKKGSIIHGTDNFSVIWSEHMLSMHNAFCYWEFPFLRGSTLNGSLWVSGIFFLLIQSQL